ncbi:MAG: DUF2510 domain-containing protein [Microbacterium sp.]|uniref:DUF2510 domain-containing protein n=1 Tax=Microbacterium sp. TaxID=51671 RepID=UPI001AC70109|nr:DUF2510 domain-containing protein [Microbacterium sp.]MBN9177832.1 DUF2510 domain-containing protein [Microbacterium sp.]
MSAPAGWYPDPTDPSRQRWWDGAQWAAPAPAAQYAPAPQYASAPQVASPVAARVAVDTNTVWVWLAIAMSVLPIGVLFLIDWDGYFAALAQAGSGVNPTADLLAWEAHVFAVSALSWIAMAAFIVFSWLDWRELRRRGVPAPFHWAWSFFALLNSGLAVYMIGRAVVLKRRTVAGGWPPLWVWIGTTVLTFVVAIVWMIGFVSKLFTVVGGMAA